MSLSVGDAILDVDSVPVTTVVDTSNAICAGLRKNGYVTLVIEQPNDPLAAVQVRQALMAEKSIEMDLPLAPDVIDICKQECKRMKRNPDLKPKESILKCHSNKSRAVSSRIQVSEETEDIPIACEDNPALLMKVPSKPPTGQYFSIAETQKQS
uniref:PDZ domain-containing protein n=1 Tax=Setaria digitata TaxID=48799 RepID=A0A915PP82_9BILA